MPNLKPPVTTVAMAAAYRERILAALPAGARFEPLMTLYLTDTTSPEEIRRRSAAASSSAPSSIPPARRRIRMPASPPSRRSIPRSKRWKHCGLVFQVHGEVTDGDVDVFDRERVFIDRILAPGRRALPGSARRVRARHDARSSAVRQERAPRRRRDDHAAAPAAESQRDLSGRHPPAQLLPAGAEARARPPRADRSGDRATMLASSSARTARRTRRHTKETACGCAGIFSAHAAIELYAEAFEQAGALERLQAFASERGADFYGLPRNREHITLERSRVDAAGRLSFRPGRAGAVSRRRADRLAPGRGAACVSERLPLASRFRGFMPVVIDVECGGFNPNTDALLEIAAVLIELRPDGRLAPGESWRYHVQPFEGAKLEAGVARRDRHRSVPSAAAGDPGEGSADAAVQGSAPRDEGERLHARDSRRPQRVLRPELPQRGGRAHRRSSAIRFTRSRASTRRRSPAWSTGRRCSARRCRRRASAGIRAKRIPRRTTRSARQSCSVEVCNRFNDSVMRG